MRFQICAMSGEVSEIQVKVVEGERRARAQGVLSAFFGTWLSGRKVRGRNERLSLWSGNGSGVPSAGCKECWSVSVGGVVVLLVLTR